MRTVFRVFLIIACFITAVAGVLVTTAPIDRAAFVASPLLGGLALLLQLRRSSTPRRKPAQELAARIGDLSEQLQRERIESGNRLAALEARMSSLESERLHLDDVHAQHRATLAQLRGALASHQAELNSTFASLAAEPTG